MNNKNTLNEIYSMFARLGMGEVKPTLNEDKATNQAKARFRQVIENGNSWLKNCMDQPCQETDAMEGETNFDYEFRELRSHWCRNNIKHLPVVANILYNELNYRNTNEDATKVGVFKKIIGLINNSEYSQMPWDKAIQYSYNDWVNIFQQTMEDEENAENEKIKNMQFNQSDYTIKQVSFEEAKQYGDLSGGHDGKEGHKLCYTQSQNTWNIFTRNDENTVHVCLKNGWENVEPNPGENAPMDEYGLSMIFVMVNPEGELTTSNVRWNHAYVNDYNHRTGDSRSVDMFLSKSEISQIVQVDFDSTFKGYDKYANLTQEVQEKLDSGMELKDIFDRYTTFQKGIVRVMINSRYNLVADRRVLCKQWFDECYDFNEGLALVKNREDKWSYLRTDGKFIDGGDTTNLWFDYCYDFCNGFARVMNNKRKYSFLRTDGKFIDGGDTTNLWFNGCNDFHNGLAMVVNSEGKCTFLRSDGKFIDGGDTTNLWFNACYDFQDGLARVRNSEGKWSYIRTDGKFIDGGDTTNLWLESCYNFSEGLAIVRNNEDKYSFLRTDGKFIDGGDTTNLWFDECYEFQDGLARVRNDNYDWSFLRKDGKFIDGGDTTNLWFDGCTAFNDGLAKVEKIKNGKSYSTFIRTDGKFIDGGDTTNLWFTRCSFFKEGFVRVQNSEGCLTYLRKDGKFIGGGDTTNLWFLNCGQFCHGFASVIDNEGHHLYIDQEGNLYNEDPRIQVSEAKINRIIRNVLNEIKLR